MFASSAVTRAFAIDLMGKGSQLPAEILPAYRHKSKHVFGLDTSKGV